MSNETHLDDISLVAQGAYEIFASGIIAGNSIDPAQAAKLSAMILGHVRSPETLGLIGASAAYPGRTSLCENAIIGVIKKNRWEAIDFVLDTIATVVAKLMDRKQG